MIGKLLDKLFGNKITLVTAQRLGSWVIYEAEIVFNKKQKIKNIKECLRQKGYYTQYPHELTIKRKRTKSITSPQLGYHRVLKERIARHLDD